MPAVFAELYVAARRGLRRQGLRPRDGFLFVGLMALGLIQHRRSALLLVFVAYLPLVAIYGVAKELWRLGQRQQ
jgi:hypothetical protein